jgi:hypothetical protein
MKRVVLLILALVLLSDMAEDGCLGKAKFVGPASSAKTSHTSSLKDCTGRVDSLHSLQSPDGDLAPPRQLQQVTLELHPALKIVVVTHSGSSGGIPL